MTIPEQFDFSDFPDEGKPSQVVFKFIKNPKSKLHFTPEGFSQEETDRTTPVVFEGEGDRLLTINEGYHLELNLGTCLSRAALFASHFILKTGERVDINFETGRPNTRYPIHTHVEVAKANPDELFDLRYEDFNMGVQELYRRQIEVDRLLTLSPQDQLVAAHAAYRFTEDFHLRRITPLPPAF